MKRRLAKPADYPALVTIWRKSVQQTHDFLKEADFKQIEVELPSYFEQMDVQIWQEEEQLLGFSGILDKKLEMLFLDPAFIGKGYGKQIIHRLIQEENCQFVDVND